MDISKTGHKIRMIISNINNAISEKVAPYGIKSGQFDYFFFIYQNEGINQNELAKIKNVGKASVTKAVKILEEQNFVYRALDEDDKRNYKLYASEKGKKHIDSMLKQRKKMEQVVFEGFSENEKDTLDELLSRMLKNTEKLL